MASEKKYALYLVKEGERPSLFHADDVEAAKANGWTEPDFPKSNGASWNAEEDLPGQTIAAELAKQKKEADDEKAAKEEKPAKKPADK